LYLLIYFGGFMADLFENPMGTNGFEFVEYAHPEPEKLRDLFDKLGFKIVAKHKSKNVTLHRQGQINFIINAEPDSFAQRFAKEHGPCACAMAFRVKNAQDVFKKLIKKGAIPIKNEKNLGPGELDIPAIEGIGGSRLYLVDKFEGETIYDYDFDFIDGVNASVKGNGLTYVDHLTHNVYQGNMDKWSAFYEDLFNFREIRYFDIEGKLTGLVSRAMTSPCGKIRIPINESQDNKSQIVEYLEKYKGEGIQHIALGTQDIYSSVEGLRNNGVTFLTTPATYYEKVDARVPEHGEDLERMKNLHILVDGAPTDGQGTLLQIFTKEVIGPIFFELIQRKGNEGFGEGNFQALFDSIEEDQIRRGVLKA